METFKENQVYILDNILLFYSAKSGNTTLRQWYLNYKFGFVSDDVIKIRKLTNSLLKKKFSDKYNKGNYDNYIKVIVVRNPYDRVVSMFIDKFINIKDNIYKFLSTNDITFNIFLELLEKEKNESEFYNSNKHFIPQSLSREKINFDYVVKLESFQDDMLNFIHKEIDENYKYDFTKKAGNFKSNYNEENYQDLTNIKLSKLRNLESINKKSFLNQKNKDIIYNLYKNDFLKFNYEK